MRPTVHFINLSLIPFPLYSGLLQSTAAHLEMYLDEVRQQIDHGRSQETRQSWRRGLRHRGLDEERRNCFLLFIQIRDQSTIKHE